MSVLLNDEPTTRTAFLERDFRPIEAILDADGLAEYRSEEYGLEPNGQIVIEVQPLTRLGRHTLTCMGCIICFDAGIQERESWRGI